MKGWIDYSDGCWSFTPLSYYPGTDRPPEITIPWWRWMLMQIVGRLNGYEQRYLRRLDEARSP